MANAFKEVFKKELDCLQQQIIVPWGKDETCRGAHFLLLSKPNDSLSLSFDRARFNQAFIIPVYRGPTINDVFPGLTHCVLTNNN